MQIHDDILEALIPEEAAWSDYFARFLTDGEDGRVSRAKSSMLAQIFRRSPVGFAIFSPDGELIFANDVAASLLGFDREREPKITWEEITTRRVIRGPNGKKVPEPIDPFHSALGAVMPLTTEYSIIDPETGFDDWVSITSYPLHADLERRELVGVAMSLIDVSDYKGMQEMLYHQATHDSLTGLTNRATVIGGANKAFKIAKEKKDAIVLFLASIDELREINNDRGHEVKDQVVIKTAERISREIGDAGTVARDEGADFVVLMTGIPIEQAEEFAAEKAEAIVRAAGKSCHVRGGDVDVSICVGASIYPRDGATGDALHRRADIALHDAISAGRGEWRVFVQEDD